MNSKFTECGITINGANECPTEKRNSIDWGNFQSAKPTRGGLNFSNNFSDASGWSAPPVEQRNNAGSSEYGQLESPKPDNHRSFGEKLRSLMLCCGKADTDKEGTEDKKSKDNKKNEVKKMKEAKKNEAKKMKEDKKNEAKKMKEDKKNEAKKMKEDKKDNKDKEE